MQLPLRARNCDPDKLRPSMTCAAPGSGSGEVFDPDHRGTQPKPGKVAFQGLVVAGRDAPPRLELVDQALDGVPLLVKLGVGVDGASPFAALRLPVGGLVPFLRDHGLDAAPTQVARLPRDEYALSPATASGLVRGRLTGPRTWIFPSTGMNCGLSAACPAVKTNANGRHLRSAARWTFDVCPPRERPSRAAFSRILRRRRTRRRSSRSGSAPPSCPLRPSGPPPLT